MTIQRALSAFVAVATFAFSVSTQAGVINFDSRAIFEAAGTINEFQDFEGFDSNIITILDSPFVDGSITYEGDGGNILVGSNSFINPISNTFSNNSFDTTVTGTIGGTFDMFAMDIALNDVNAAPPTSLTLVTNLDTYIFDLILPDVQEAQLFQGWIAMSGEYFTGFSFENDNFVHIDNVTLGTSNAVNVAEPSTILLIGIGMIGLWGYRRKSS